MKEQALQMVAAQALQAEAQVDKQLDRYDLANLTQKDLNRIRDERLLELKMKSKQLAEWKALGHGQYEECNDQRVWFEEVKRNRRVVCHFYRTSNEYCAIVDKHLKILAQQHLETRFIKIDAEKAPYLSEKLEVVLLPTILCTKEGFTADRVEGFADFGERYDFSTKEMENRLLMGGVIDPKEYRPKNKGGRETNNANNRSGKAIYESRPMNRMVELDDDDFDISD